MLYNMHFTSKVMSVVTANNTVEVENLTNLPLVGAEIWQEYITGWTEWNI
jgi:uncharacterized membrane protein